MKINKKLMLLYFSRAISGKFDAIIGIYKNTGIGDKSSTGICAEVRTKCLISRNVPKDETW